jgi:hypothetical protein
LNLKDDSKGNASPEEKQSSPQEVTIKEKQDEPQQSKEVEINAEEEKHEDKTGEDGHATMPTSSSIKYTPPSTSNESCQASSVQESLHESDDIPEATAGGPELVSVSSTSRLSASLGMQEEEFAKCTNLILRGPSNSCSPRSRIYRRLRVSVLQVILPPLLLKSTQRYARTLCLCA